MARPWIRVCTTLRDHPKILKLARISKTSTRESIGGMVQLWSYAMANRRDGNFKEIVDELEAICGYTQGQLVTAGFMEKDGRLHDWWEYTGKSVKAIERHNEVARISAENRRDSARTTNLSKNIGKTAYNPTPRKKYKSTGISPSEVADNYWKKGAYRNGTKTESSNVHSDGILVSSDDIVSSPDQ